MRSAPMNLLPLRNGTPVNKQGGERRIPFQHRGKESTRSFGGYAWPLSVRLIATRERF